MTLFCQFSQKPLPLKSVMFRIWSDSSSSLSTIFSSIYLVGVCQLCITITDTDKWLLASQRGSLWLTALEVQSPRMGKASLVPSCGEARGQLWRSVCGRTQHGNPEVRAHETKAIFITNSLIRTTFQMHTPRRHAWGSHPHSTITLWLQYLAICSLRGLYQSQQQPC